MIYYPKLKDSARMKKLPTGIYITELYSGSGSQYSARVGFIMALCSGAVGTDTIAKCMTSSFGITEDEANTQLNKVLGLCGAFLEMNDEPVDAPFRYDFADFFYETREFADRLETPVDAQLILTNRCNFRCIYCFNSSGPEREKEMSTDNWLELVRQMRELGVMKVDLTGGEPMAMPGFGAILDACAEADMLITVFTNGSLITPEWAARFAKIKSLLVQVSIDTPYDDVFDHVTDTKSMMNKVVNAIKLLVAAGVPTRCKALIIPETMDGVPDLIRLCEQLGIMQLTLDTYDLCRVGRGDERFFMRPQDSERIRELVEKQAERLNGKMVAVYSEGRKRWQDENDIIRCGALSQGFSIMSTGDYTLCEKTTGDPNCSIGRFPELPLSEMWKSPRIKTIMKPAAEEYQQPCRDCEHLPHCHGGCPAAARLVSDKPHSADPRCWKTEYPDNPFSRAGNAE